MHLRIIVTITILLSFSQAKACFCGSHYTGINNYSGTALTIPADTLPKGKFALGYAMNYQDYDSFGFNLFRQTLNKRAHSHSIDALLTQSINLSYGLTEDLSLIASFPLQSYLGLDSTAGGFRINDGNSIGIGDFSFFAKYRFLKKKKMSAAIIAGLKIPSGDTNQKNEFGFLLSPDLQPGSDSWDPLLGLSFSKAFKHFNFHASSMYKLATEGSQNTSIGDSVNFNLGLSKKLTDRHKFLGQNLSWGLIAEANGIWRGKLETNGLKDSNHGGLVLFLTPGLRLGINDRIYNTLFMSFPVIQDLNGIQSDIAFQLGYNLSLVF